MESSTYAQFWQKIITFKSDQFSRHIWRIKVTKNRIEFLWPSLYFSILSIKDTQLWIQTRLSHLNFPKQEISDVNVNFISVFIWKKSFHFFIKQNMKFWRNTLWLQEFSKFVIKYQILENDLLVSLACGWNGKRCSSRPILLA